jgi:hypothetical protein
MELKKPGRWTSLLNIPTALMFTLSVITIIFSVIIARSSSLDTVQDAAKED